MTLKDKIVKVVETVIKGGKPITWEDSKEDPKK